MNSRRLTRRIFIAFPPWTEQDTIFWGRRERIHWTRALRGGRFRPSDNRSRGNSRSMEDRIYLLDGYRLRSAFGRHKNLMPRFRSTCRSLTN